MSPITPETASKISIWRQKAAEGTLTQDEMREAIILMREGRMAAAKSPEAKRRTAAKAAVPDADDLLAELGL